jgi:hypothetical protein
MVQVSRRKPRFVEWQPDDLMIGVAYTQANGERVEAWFAHVGWLVAPLRPLRPFAVQQRTGYRSIFSPVNPKFDARRRALLGLPPEPQPEDPELWLHHPGGSPQSRETEPEPARIKVFVRRPKVMAWERDDQFITVAYRHANGERVTGLFHAAGWRKPPLKVIQQFHRAQSRGYVAWYRPASPTPRREAGSRQSPVARVAIGGETD